MKRQDAFSVAWMNLSFFLNLLLLFFTRIPFDVNVMLYRLFDDVNCTLIINMPVSLMLRLLAVIVPAVVSTIISDDEGLFNDPLLEYCKSP